MSKEKDHQPAWLSSQYDDKHREEAAPLLGSGKPNLQDPEAPAQEEKDEQEKDAKGDYGSVATKSTAKSDEATAVTRTAEDEEAAREKAAALKAKPHVPSQNPCLWLFHLLEGTTIIASLCLLATQVLPLIIVPAKDITTRIGVLSLGLKVYIALFCVLFILVEWDVPVFFVRNSQLLQGYFSRGFIYSFIGLICVEEAYSEQVKDMVAHGRDSFHIGWASVFMQISSWCMLAVGVVYMLLGMCCMKRLRDRMKQREKDQWTEYNKAMKNWKELYQ